LLLILAVTALAVGLIRLNRLGKDYPKRCAADLEDEWYRRIAADLEDEWRRQEEGSRKFATRAAPTTKKSAFAGVSGRLRHSGDRQSCLETKGQRL